MRPVVVVSHGFQSHYEAGFCNGLAANGVFVYLLGSDNSLSARLGPGVELHNIRGSQRSDRPALAKALNLVCYRLRLWAFVLRHRRSTVMVIGLFDWPWLGGVAEMLLLRLLSRRLWLTVHNILPHDQHTAAMKLAHRLIYRIPHRLVVHTEATRDVLQREFGIDARRIVVMAHGANDAVLPSPVPREALRAAAGLAADRLALLFFGGVVRYKGADLLLDATDGDARIQRVFAGRCAGDAYGQGVRARLQAAVADGSALWREGYVSDEQVAELFAMCDAVVLPYRHIDQSGILLLALTLGLPVIATRVGEFERLVDDGLGVLADEATAPSLARAIDRFAERAGGFDRAAIARRGALLAWPVTTRALLPHLA